MAFDGGRDFLLRVCDMGSKQFNQTKMQPQQYRGGPQVTVASVGNDGLARIAREQQEALMEMEEERKEQRRNRITTLVQQAPTSRGKPKNTTTTTTRSSQAVLNRQFSNQTTLRPGRAVPALPEAYFEAPDPPPPPPDSYMEVEVVPLPPLRRETVSFDTRWTGPCECSDVKPVRILRTDDWVCVQIPRFPPHEVETPERLVSEMSLPEWARPTVPVAQLLPLMCGDSPCHGIVTIDGSGRITIGLLEYPDDFFPVEVSVPYSTSLNYFVDVFE